MINRITLGLSGLVLYFFVSIIALNSSASASLFGETQNYDVVMRGNGNASVLVNINIDNNDDEPINVLNYTQSEGTLKSVRAYQYIKCNSMPSIALNGSLNETSNSISPEDAVPNKQCYPSYFEDYLLGSKITDNSSSTYRRDYFRPSYEVIYKKVDIVSDDKNIALNLTEAIEPTKDTNIILIYDLEGVAEKKLGIYNFIFDTLKTPKPVANVNVAITVDDGYYLDDADSNIDYAQTATTSNTIQDSLAAGVSTEASNSAFNRAISNVGKVGQINKKATRLSENESLTVEGRYSDAAWRFNIKTYFVWAAVAILLVIAFVIIYKRNKRRLDIFDSNVANRDKTPITADEHINNNDNTKVDANYNQDNEQPYLGKIAPSPILNTSKSSSALRAMPFYNLISTIGNKIKNRKLPPAIFGLGVVLLTSAIFLVSYYGLGALWQLADNNTYGDSSVLFDVIIPGLAIVMTFLSILTFILLITAAPAIYCGGFKKAAKTYIYIVLFYFLLTIVIAVYATFVAQPDYNDNDRYYPYINDSLEL